MARSLFQRPAGSIARTSLSGFRGRYRPPEFEEDEWPAPRNEQGTRPRSFFSRLPLLIKIIVLLFAAAVGIIVAFIAWLIVGALTL
jgi:hypothetical protein